MQANGLTTYDIKAGQVLVIPGGVVTPTSTPTGTLTPSATYVPPTPIAHVVQPGETLCALARRYNTSVWAIMAYNRLYTTTIFAYSTLLIPPAPQAGPVIHVVQAGNTLYSLARAYHTTIWAIMAANGLSNANIYVGQSLVIPTGPYGGTWLSHRRPLWRAHLCTHLWSSRATRFTASRACLAPLLGRSRPSTA